MVVPVVAHAVVQCRAMPRAHRVPDEDAVPDVERATDLEEVVRVAAEAGVFLAAIRGNRGTPGPDMVEEHEAIVVGEG